MAHQENPPTLSFPRGWGELTEEKKREGSQPHPDSLTALHLKKESRLAPLRKFLPIFLALLVIVGVGLGIFKLVLPRGQKAPEEVVLTYWGLWEPAGVMKGVLADWEKNHPKVKIKYTQQSHREYRERLQSALARNEGPDIFRFHITWLPMFKNELAPIPPEVMSASECWRFRSFPP